MDYTVGLRNKQALCITLPKKAAEGAGIAQKCKVRVENVDIGYIVPCKAILVYKPTEAPKKEATPEVPVKTEPADVVNQ